MSPAAKRPPAAYARAVFALLVLLIGAPHATGDVAQRLDRADEAVASLEYEDAREVLLDVVSDPDASEDELVRAHMLAGQVDRILKRDVDAKMHFQWVLTRFPDAELPPGHPPKIVSFFEMVRDEVRSRAAERATPSPPAPALAAPQAAAATPAAIAAPQESAIAAPQGSGAPPLLALASGGLVIVATTTAVVGEVMFADRRAAWSTRSTAQLLALGAWGAAAVGAVGVAVGVATWGDP